MFTSLNREVLLKVIIAICISLVTPNLWALDKDGSGAKDASLKALYLFSETTGDILDVSGVEPALNLRVENATAVDRQPGYLNIKQDTVVSSINPASKIINSCGTEITVEMWIENNRSAKPPTLFQGDPVPLTLFGFSNPAGENVLNFNQFYEDEDIYRIDNKDESLNSPVNLVELNTLQHIYYVQNKSDIKLFVGDENRVSRALINKFDNNLTWVNDAKLTIGQRANFNSSPNASVFEKWSWKGRVHLMAVYCKALTDTDIMGDLSPKPAFKAFDIDPDKEITDNHRYASLLYRRLAGVKTPFGNPVIEEMAQKISEGKFLEAANKATSESGFYNITVRDFASRLSTRDESVNTTLNDFVAGFIGIARDDKSAKELLTGNFYYAGDPTKTAVPNNMIRDHLKSNNHYEKLDSLNYDLSQVLKRYEGQNLYMGSNRVSPNPDPAGVITSRAFMAAHAIAGTNRRLVEYAFREFLCVPIEKWSDATGPDNMIGKDIDRFPAGDHHKFTVSCRSCHSNMDGFRGAFSQFSFSANVVKNALVMPAGSGESDSTMLQSPIGVAAKYNQNASVFPNGFETTTNYFVNNATRGVNKNYFGWGSKTTGRGVRAFGSMIADAKAFPRCLAKRAFRSTCKREPTSTEISMIDSIGDDFAKKGFKLRYLFERIATRPECLGK